MSLTPGIVTVVQENVPIVQVAVGIFTTGRPRTKIAARKKGGIERGPVLQGNRPPHALEDGDHVGQTLILILGVGGCPVGVVLAPRCRWTFSATTTSPANPSGWLRMRQISPLIKSVLVPNRPAPEPEPAPTHCWLILMTTTLSCATRPCGVLAVRKKGDALSVHERGQGFDTGITQDLGRMVREEECRRQDCRVARGYLGPQIYPTWRWRFSKRAMPKCYPKPYRASSR